MAVRAKSPVRPGGMNHPPFDAVADVRKAGHIQDDFVVNVNGTLDDTLTTGLGALHWLVTDVNGSPDSDVDLTSTAATVQDHPGVISLNTGPTTPAGDDEASLFLSHPDAFILSDTTPVYGAAIVRFPSVTQIEFYFGLFDSLSAAGRGVNSVSIELDVSVQTYFQSVVVDGSSATATAVPSEGQTTGAIDTWYVLEILATETSCLFFVDGTLINEETGANIPDDEGLTWGFKVATETTAEKSVLIDAFQSHWVVDRTNRVS